MLDHSIPQDHIREVLEGAPALLDRHRQPGAAPMAKAVDEPAPTATTPSPGTPTSPTPGPGSTGDITPAAPSSPTGGGEGGGKRGQGAEGGSPNQRDMSLYEAAGVRHLDMLAGRRDGFKAVYKAWKSGLDKEAILEMHRNGSLDTGKENITPKAIATILNRIDETLVRLPARRQPQKQKKRQLVTPDGRLVEEDPDQFSNTAGAETDSGKNTTSSTNNPTTTNTGDATSDDPSAVAARTPVPPPKNPPPHQPKPTAVETTREAAENHPAGAPKAMLSPTIRTMPTLPGTTRTPI